MSAVGDYDLKDSGKREQMLTGSQRDSREGKGRYDLLPFRALRRLAKVFERGAKKYNARNWELGQSLSRTMDSGLRHLGDYMIGRNDEDHLAQAAWNIMVCLETEERIKEGLLPSDLDDLPGNPTGIKPTVASTDRVLEQLRKAIELAEKRQTTSTTSTQ